jgi:transposase-like protein
MTERAAPFYCPYCGDEDLRPHERSAATHPAQEESHAAWLCAGCRRVFTVKFVGLNLTGPTALEEVTK